MSPVPSPENNQSATSHSRWLLPIYVVIAGLLVLGIYTQVHKSNPKTVTQSTVSAIKHTAQVSITADGFSPQTLQAKPGSTVTWTNNDTAPHEVAPDPYPKNDSIPSMDTPIVLQTGDSFSFSFDKAGTYHYHDQLNPLKLFGTVQVK